MVNSITRELISFAFIISARQEDLSGHMHRHQVGAVCRA
ncbi:hypothetical protein CZ765_06130 [Corynebacterium casei]|uniref:Uncharacterized protein n=1 Tax=Corynebacterium casei UCMA 3821 TaxID=1110505 RepID=G7HX41_9CORY|nr:putative uncharacterized protein [Corynebacterium casei UCMA 3821]SLM89692.1 hypothetical protein CZ765_06130 [Corynebacterium casei]